MTRLRTLAALLLSFCLPMFAQERERPNPPVDANDARFAATEDGCPSGRIADYLRRHGDRGVIDPNVLLERTRAMQEELEHDRVPRFQTEGIGGTVWTSLGPNNGAGRATAIALHPTTSGTVIAGAAGGGAWKTTDSGATWAPLTESIANLSVGAIAYAPSNGSIVYLGTGEGGYAGDFIPGIGLLYSSDGGANWTLPSSVLATEFYKISVDPANANTLVVGTNSGGYRSTNGQNGPWTQVIRSASSGATVGYGDVTSIVRDPGTPATMYATTWDRDYWAVRNGYGDPYNLNSATVLKSTDGGQTWNPANSGLPVNTVNTHVSRMTIAIAPSSTQTLYVSFSTYDALSANTTSHIYKSTNGGGSWTETGLSANVNTQSYLGTQAWYGNSLVVSPTDANTVIGGGIGYVKTTDGGTNWAVPTMNGVHVDVHDLEYQGSTLWIANDGGVWTSGDNANSATDRTAGLITRQFYTLANDPSNRNRVIGGTQDNGTNRRGDAGGTSWDYLSGGDGFGVAVNPFAPGVAFSSYQYENVLRTTNVGAASPVVSARTPPYASGEAVPFSSIVKLDPTTPSTVYATSYRVWKSTDSGESWTPLPITTTDASTWHTNYVIDALAISKSNPQVLMVVSGGAQVFRTTNGGSSWVQAISGLPGNSITDLEIDPTDPLKVYAALAGTSGTMVYYTTNGGASWSPRGSGLPNFSAQCVRVDPTDTQTLYAGTDVGVYRSTDGGASWSRFGTGMPAVSVYDLQALSDGSILRAATHGRGMWQLTVTGVTNHAPAASISAPATAQTIAKGTTLTFTGSFSDADADVASWRWTFPDNWSTASNVLTTTHRFDRSGVFPVTFTATDAHGATGAAQLLVTVTQSGDACANPIVVPGAGPFPYSISMNTEAASTEGTDPIGSCYPYSSPTSVWLSFTPSSTGVYNFSFCGSQVSGVMEGFTGAACGTYTEVPGLCLISYGPSTNCIGTATSVTLTAGTTYRLLLTNYYYNDVGPTTLTITQSSAFSPVVATVSPASGPASGGTALTINGVNFTSGATVSVGGVAATNVQVLSGTSITATAPAHAPGTVNVTVTNGGTATLSGAYTYLSVGGIVRADSDGDRKTDISIFRPLAGDWYFRRSSDGGTTYIPNFGPGSSDIPVPGDYDGDGKTDIAIFRPLAGDWYIRRSTDGGTTYIPNYGPSSNDKPVAADYDGDGKTDIAIFRSGTGEWFVRQSSNGQTVYTPNFGPGANDIPVPADYDGDGKADIAIFRPGTGEWFIKQSSNGQVFYLPNYGPQAGDKPVPADYDGDGKADIAIFRPLAGDWFIRRSTDGGTTYIPNFGPNSNDKPVPADYDGDGKADIAIFRSGTGEWFVKQSTNGAVFYLPNYGPQSNDKPVPAYAH
jgi:IPT/TIG domain/PKD domain/FG-GAP-like repeat/FG-GAP repeat